MARDESYPEYGLKISEEAAGHRAEMPVEYYPVLDQILRGLASDPRQWPHRLSTKDDVTYLYTHPEPNILVDFRIAEEEKNIYVVSVVAPNFKPKKSFFISYSRVDEEWLVMIKKFLYVLEEQGVIEFWDDTKIAPGSDWKLEIQQALDSAKAAVLLVSQDFLISDFIRKFELPKLLQDAETKGKKIFWIPVRPSTVLRSHKEIAKFQPLVRDPSKSLDELSKPECEAALVEVSATLEDLH